MQTSVLTWVIGSFIVIINIYFLITSFVKLLLHSGLSTVSQVFSGIFWVPGHADLHSRDPIPRLPEEQEVHPAIAGERC